MADRRGGILLRTQLRLLVPLALTWTITGIIVTIAGLQNVVPVQNLFLDAAAVSDLPWYTGLLSNLGILCWSTSVTVAACGAWIAFHTSRPSAATFLATGAGATAVLLVDDLLQIHAEFMPHALSIPKPAAMLIVIGPTMFWGLTNLREIKRTRWIVLVAATAALGLSVTADRIGGHLFGTILFEDGAKLFGVVAWTLYFATTTRDIAQSTVREAMHRSDPTGPMARVEERQGT